MSVLFTHLSPPPVSEVVPKGLESSGDLIQGRFQLGRLSRNLGLCILNKPPGYVCATGPWTELSEANPARGLACGESPINVCGINKRGRKTTQSYSMLFSLLFNHAILPTLMPSIAFIVNVSFLDGERKDAGIDVGYSPCMLMESFTSLLLATGKAKA